MSESKWGESVERGAPKCKSRTVLSMVAAGSLNHHRYYTYVLTRPNPGWGRIR
jgi:hypothetical protein